MGDKISIIIPCYNEENTVGSCVENIMGQTIGSDMLELVIVNDASTDNTWKVLLELERKYPDNVLVIDCEENGKQGKARNIGVSYSSGNYLMFADADDLMTPDAVEILYRKMKETGADIVECEHLDFGDLDRERLAPVLKGDKKVSDIFETQTVLEEGLYDMEDIWARKDYMRLWGERSCVWGLIINRDFYESAGLYFPEGVFMEECFFGELIMTECRKLYHLSDKLYLYYRNLKNGVTHGENLKKNYMHKHFSYALLVVELKKRGTFSTFVNELAYCYFHNVLLERTYYMKEAFDEFPMANYIEMKNYMKSTFPDYLSAPFIDEDELDLYRAVFGQV